MTEIRYLPGEIVRLSRFVVVVVLLFSCAPKVPDSHSDPNAGITRIRHQELRVAAEDALDCDKEHIGYQYLGDKVHLLTGCGREIRYLIFNFNNVWVKIESFHRRASFELDCAVDKLITEHINEGRWRVSGCGQSVTYVLDCNENNQDCEWFRLSGD